MTVPLCSHIAKPQHGDVVKLRGAADECVDVLADGVQQHFGRRVEQAGDVGLGNDEGVSLGEGIDVKIGEGEVVLQHILNGAEEMYGKGRVFAHTVLAPGCEIGWHIHHGDGETYYILKGTGLYNNNGEEVTVGSGDITFVDDGEGHSLRNIGEDNLETIALILYK